MKIIKKEELYNNLWKKFLLGEMKEEDLPFELKSKVDFGGGEIWSCNAEFTLEFLVKKHNTINFIYDTPSLL
jgi:hypothetical protein